MQLKNFVSNHFYLCLSNVKSVFDCRLSGVFRGLEKKCSDSAVTCEQCNQLFINSNAMQLNAIQCIRLQVQLSLLPMFNFSFKAKPNDEYF